MTQGSEVILGCKGDVTVDGVQLAVATKTKERPKKESISELLRKPNDGNNHGATGSYHSKTDATHGTHQTMEPSVIDFLNKPLTTDITPVTTPKENRMTARVLWGNLQTTQHYTSVSVSREEKAVSMTTTRNFSTDTSAATKFEDYDYEDMEEGIRVTRSVRRRARWTKNGQLLQEGVGKGGVFRLPALRMVDAGNYNCYRGDRLVSSIKISVGGKCTYIHEYIAATMLKLYM